MQVPEEIKSVIKQIEVLSRTSKTLWNELYKWLEDNNIKFEDDTSMAIDEVANLQDGVGAETLIEWLEKQ